MTNWNGPQPAPRALWQTLHANFPIVRNLGIYNHRNVAGTHTPSHHSEGRALDIGLSVSIADEKMLGDQLFTLLIDSAGDLGLDEIIWNRQIWSTQRPMVHPYQGQNPHTDHIHVGFTRTASQNQTLPPRFIVRVASLRTGLEDLRSRVVGATSNVT
jgi:hypothetical protein